MSVFALTAGSCHTCPGARAAEEYSRLGLRWGPLAYRVGGFLAGLAMFFGYLFSLSSDNPFSVYVAAALAIQFLGERQWAHAFWEERSYLSAVVYAFLALAANAPPLFLTRHSDLFLMVLSIVLMAVGFVWHALLLAWSFVAQDVDENLQRAEKKAETVYPREKHSEVKGGNYVTIPEFDRRLKQRYL